MLVVTSCSKDETAPAPATAPAPGAAAAKGPTPVVEGQLPKIPILPGYKYYVGGPLMKKDVHGRFRIASFNGEVEQPPSRGMIFGAKRDGDQMEYRVWGNGVLLGVHRGVMRDGVFWQTYVEGYRSGKLMARENTVNDDTIKRSKTKHEDIDPETGELIRTTESSVSYLPAAMPDDLEDEDEEEEDEGAGNMVPAPGVKPAAPAPSAPVAPVAPAAPKPAGE